MQLCNTCASKSQCFQKNIFSTIDSILFYLFLPISGECQRFRKRATLFATSFPFPLGFLPKKFFFCQSLPHENCQRSSFASSSRLQRFPPTAVSERPPASLRTHTLHQKRRIYNRPPRLFQAAEKIKHGVNEEKSMDKSFLVKKVCCTIAHRRNVRIDMCEYVMFSDYIMQNSPFFSLAVN